MFESNTGKLKKIDYYINYLKEFPVLSFKNFSQQQIEMFK